MKHLKKIPEAYQFPVYLRYVEDLWPHEIAEITGESVNSVSVKINRGIEALRVMLGYKNK